MTLKLPPPPPIANLDPAFNRWLIELTSILANSGGIDPSTITGYTALQDQVATNTSDIATLETRTGGQSGSITVLQTQVAVLIAGLAAANAQITALGARAQVFNGTVDPANGLGNVNDWYANTAGAAGHRIFVKTGVATWTAFPF